MDRDLNAAKNIRFVGFDLGGDFPGMLDVPNIGKAKKLLVTT